MNENATQPMDEDDILLADLRRAASQADAAPSLVLESARAAFGLRRLDAEIAELLHDSAVDESLVLVRGAENTRMLSFEHDSVQVDMQVTETGSTRSLLAIVSGAQPDVRVEHSGGEVSVTLDEGGRLLVDDIPAGRLRLHLTSVGGVAVTTSWIQM